MFKIVHNFNKLTLANTNFAKYETVRWRRKPRWLPVAKSKMFKVPPRQRAPPEEAEEMKRLFNNYRTHIKSIRKFLYNEYNSKLIDIDPEVQAKHFEEDFAKCTEINDKWNAEIKLSREKRVAASFELEKEQALQRLIDRSEIQRQSYEEAEETVREQKEKSKSFITPDKLDAAIEYALANPKDYNFALDIDGNVIHGRETKPPAKSDPK